MDKKSLYINDYLVIGALKQDDHGALAFLFDKYYKDMVMYAGTLLPEITACEDIVQNMFFSLWNERHKLAIHTSLKSYMLRVVRNSCFDELRHRKVKHTHTIYEFKMALKGEEDTSKYILHSDLQKHLEEALNKLRPEERKIFEMNRFDGKKSKEISEELNIPLRTVQLRISKAVEKLRDLLNDFYLLLLIFCIYCCAE